MKPGISLLPEPRSYVGTAVMICVITGVPFGLMAAAGMAAMQAVPLSEFLPWALGTGWAFGVFMGLIMAIFIKGQTSTIAAGDPNSFVPRLNVAMSQLGYNPVTRTEDFLTYKPSFQAGLAAGRISVQLMLDQAVIFGPKMYVSKLIRRLATH